jgi:uncharacterized membrane protein YkoI
MNRRTLQSLALLLLAAGQTHAQGAGPKNDAVAGASAKITLAEAVVTAEKHANGRAVRAEYEASHKGQVFDVEVVTKEAVFDVKVDAATGKVLSSSKDRSDDDDRDDAQD